MSNLAGATILVVIAFMLLPSFIVLSAYGDGLASEILPPSMIGNKNVTLSINSSPFLIDNNHVGTQINFVVEDASNQAPLQDAAIDVSVFKNGKALFGHIFMSDSGNFLFNVMPANSTNISIDEKGGPFPGLLGHSGNYDIKGPVFSSGGLYKFKINLLAIGSYDNQVSKSYNAAISIPETNQYQILDTDDGKQTVTVVAYYDQIGDFHYDSDGKKMSFTMPFSWTPDNIKQVSVVHQELKIPRSFASFIVTKYDAYVNGVQLPDKAVSIDDYSSDEYRIIHLILYKQEVEAISKQQQNTKQEMDFSLAPSNQTAFPIIQYTRNAQYKVSLSWDPPKITTGHAARFSFQIFDPYLINKTVDSTGYDFSVIEGKNGLIYHKSGTTSNDGSPNNVDVNFPDNYTGPITIGFENVNGNSFADAEFSGIVSRPHIVPEFPTGAVLAIAAVFSMSLAIVRFSKA